MISEIPKRSVLGSYSGRVHVGEDELLIALRAYLDSSGKLHDDWMTLAAVAGPESMWQEFEKVWGEIMDNHTPKGEYVHMKEIFRLEKAFDKSKGWTHENAFGLANKCLVYMSNLPKDRFRMFYCSVHLAAHRKLRAETYQIPDPVDLCNQFCSETVLGWYALKYPELVSPRTDSVKYFFDQNEDFFLPFFNKWKQETKVSEDVGVWSYWNVIEEVAPVLMRKTPGIQAADIIAWARNRQTFTEEGEIASYLMEIIHSVIPATYVVWDEQKLRHQYKPLLYLP